AGVDGAAVRRDELTGRLASEAIPDPAHQITLARQDAHAISDVGDLRVHGERGAELADVEEIALPAGREQPARPVQVLPLPLIASPVVEDLDAVVLAVGDVYETLGVGGDVMGNVEASRVGARLPPREEVSAAGIVLVHARVAVTVGDVDV